MTMVRRVFLVDEDVLMRFRMAVAGRHRNMKGAMSREINEALRDRCGFLETSVQSGRTRITTR
jgi:hypothetical protein